MPMLPVQTPTTPAASPRKTWTIGTLTYTTGALVVLFCWLLWGDFAWQLKERSAAPVVQIMLRLFKASDFLTGLFLLSLPAMIGLILGPVISYRSDRHRGRWGRRIPYLLITTPMATLSMYGIALSPKLGTWLHDAMGWGPDSLNLAIIVMMGLSWTIFEFATITANAVFGGLLNDVVPHELLGRFFGLFRAVSLGTGMFFNYYLIGHTKEHYLPIIVGIGTVYGVGFALMCFFVKEGEYPPPDEVADGQPKGVWAAAKTYARECFTNSYYWWVFAAMSLGMLSLVPVNLFSVYTAESFGLTMEGYGKYIVVTYACSLVLAYPLGWLADRIHAVRMAVITMLLYTLVMFVGYAVLAGPKSFGTIFLIHGVVSGCYFTGAAAMGQMLFPKLKFAQFASAGGMILAVCNIILGPLMGEILDRLNHDYRYTFLAGGILAFAALVSNWVVYRRFMKLGGPRGYVAP
jgi:MFS family permease